MLPDLRMARSSSVGGGTSNGLVPSSPAPASFSTSDWRCAVAAWGEMEGALTGAGRPPSRISAIASLIALPAHRQRGLEALVFRTRARGRRRDELHRRPTTRRERLRRLRERLRSAPRRISAVVDVIPPSSA